MLNNDTDKVKLFTIISYPPNKNGKPVRISTMSRQLFDELRGQAFKEKKPCIWIEKTVSFEGIDKSFKEE